MAEGNSMLFALVLGALLGGAAVTLLKQWHDAALVPGHAARLPEARRPALAAMGPRGGLVFVPREARRRAA